MIPNLPNPIMVEFKQVDTSSTVYSDPKKEPSTYVAYQPAFRVPGIMIHKKTKIIRESTGTAVSPRELGGVIEDADGYVIVRKVDLQEQGKTLKLDDRIISYGKPGSETQCKFFLVGYKEAAHYDDVGTHTLEQWFFQDRS